MDEKKAQGNKNVRAGLSAHNRIQGADKECGSTVTYIHIARLTRRR